MILALLTLISGLAISSVAIYYSVIGLTSIFSAAAIPIMIMGTILEISKLVAAWWLKKNWKRAPYFLKTYMLAAVLVLMFITSMGIFGFLSKAHIEQGVPTGDIIAQVETIDLQISLEQEIITQSRTDVALLNEQLRRFTELGAVTKSVKAREAQADDRASITKTIRTSQATISELRRDKLKMSSQLRQAEAEVGPIKYIAALLYGADPSTVLLEKAVVWVIIILVLVFDPLAILLLLSAQLSFYWYAAEKNKVEKEGMDDDAGIIQTISQHEEPTTETNQHQNTDVDDDTNEDATLEEPTKEETHEEVTITSSAIQEPEQTEIQQISINYGVENVPPVVDYLDEQWEQFDEMMQEEDELASFHQPEPELTDEEIYPTVVEEQEEPIFKELFTEEDIALPAQEVEDNSEEWVERAVISETDAVSKKKRVDWIERANGQQVKRTSG